MVRTNLNKNHHKASWIKLQTKLVRYRISRTAGQNLAQLLKSLNDT